MRQPGDPSCGGLSATLKPSLIPTTGSWMELSNLLQTSSHSCSPSTACSLTDTAYPSSMVCSRGRLQPSTRTCLKKLTPGDPTSLPLSSFLLDYELAIHNAVAEVWPSTTRRGCNFHFKQPLLKHLRQCDLIEEYRIENSPVRDGFAKMGALAFVPVEEVERVWRNLKPLLPADMVSFISYFESTWVGTSTTSPHFSHDMWNQHDASLMLLPRSSTIAEGWQHGFHSMLSCSNPTLWKFLDALKSEQALTDQKLARRKLRQHTRATSPQVDKL